MKLMEGDLYTREETSVQNNRSTGETTKTINQVIVRGDRILLDKNNNETLLCSYLDDSRRKARIWKYLDMGWNHLGPGEIRDYPEVLL